MDRRKSLKILAVGTVSAGAVLSCKEKTADSKPEKEPDLKFSYDRQPIEIERYKEITDEKFFTEHEMATITILGDIIIPKDDVSGSASDARVPDFIEFIVKDMPEHQVSMRGGLRWLDLQCLKKYEKSFAECNEKQRLEMVDQIAYPAKASPELAPGVAFFNLIRNLTATGFYTSEMGVKDLGYVGNRPNQWNGVPHDVLQQYGLSYSEKELKECVSFDKA